MVKIASLAAVSALFTAAVAKDVACVVNGVNYGTVDLDTGVCPFPIAPQLPVSFRFNTTENYTVDFYYAVAAAEKFWNDIANAGRIIEIAAIDLYQKDPAQLFYCHREENPGSNSTAAIRRRLMGASTQLDTRDAEDDFIAYLKTLTGDPVTGVSNTFQVLDVSDVSSAAPSDAPTSGADNGNGGTATVTDESTTVITITSCSDNACHKTAVPATKGLTTETVNGETTVYTTYCPLSTESVYTSTYTSEGTAYTTVCTTSVPVTLAPGQKTVAPAPAPAAVTKVITTVWTSKGAEQTSVYTTAVPAGGNSPAVAPAGNSPAVAPAAASTAPAISTFNNGAAAASAGSLVALALVPLAYFL